MKSIFLQLGVALIIFSVTGCAGIEVPTPEGVLSHPLGTESIKIGMSRQEVESQWGKPDLVNQVEDKTRWKGPREEWIYNANYRSLMPVPVDAGYLSKGKRLYFDGDNLTDISD